MWSRCSINGNWFRARGFARIRSKLRTVRRPSPISDLAWAPTINLRSNARCPTHSGPVHPDLTLGGPRTEIDITGLDPFGPGAHGSKSSWRTLALIASALSVRFHSAVWWARYLAAKPPDSPPNAVNHRDIRIDFFRGLALYMILVDHIHGDPLARLTYHAIGLSDAAEVFVYLSGLGCGLAYSRLLARSGWLTLVLTLLRRGVRLYGYYAATSCAAILLAAGAPLLWPSIPNQIRSIAGPHPLAAIESMLRLASFPADSGILVLYIPLTTLIVPLFLFCGQRFAGFALFVSGLVWALVQIDPTFTPAAVHHWYLNPFAWQFLFSIGMLLGIKWNTISISELRARAPWLLRAAWSVAIAALLYKACVFFSPYLGRNAESLTFSGSTLALMKQNLSPLRIASFLSLAALLAAYFRPTNPIFQLSLSVPIVWAGMHSLVLFSLSVVLSACVNILISAYHPLLGGRLVLDVFAVVVMTLAALRLGVDKIRRPRISLMG